LTKECSTGLAGARERERDRRRLLEVMQLLQGYGGGYVWQYVGGYGIRGWERELWLC